MPCHETNLVKPSSRPVRYRTLFGSPSGLSPNHINLRPWISRAEEVSHTGQAEAAFKLSLKLLGPLLAISRLFRLVRGTSASPATADIGPTHRGVRVEQRIEVDQIDALGRDAIAENL